MFDCIRPRDEVIRGLDLTETAHTGSIEGRHVLIVEDEAILTVDLAMELEEAGATVVTAYTMEDAITAVADETIEAAILDVDLRGQDVFDAADILYRRGVPFAFHTGHGKATDIAERFPGIPVVSKPAEVGLLSDLLAEMIVKKETGANGFLEDDMPPRTALVIASTQQVDPEIIVA